MSAMPLRERVRPGLRVLHTWQYCTTQTGLVQSLLISLLEAFYPPASCSLQEQRDIEKERGRKRDSILYGVSKHINSEKINELYSQDCG